MNLKFEISVITLTLLMIKFCGSSVDGMSLRKSSWLKWHAFNFMRRDAVIAAIYFYLWTTRSSGLLIIPILYALSLNWSLHIIGYYVGDESSVYRGLKATWFTLATGIGSSLCIVLGLLFSAFFMQHFYAFFIVGLGISLIWAIAYRLAYIGYTVNRLQPE